MTHEIPLERRTLHGHFSRDLPPIVTVDSGDTVAFSCLDSGWHVTPGAKFEPRDEELDQGHALIGPIEVRGARAGQTLAVRIDEVRVGSFGATYAGGWSTPLNDRLGMSDGETLILHWNLDADAGVGRDPQGREVELRPFPGVLGMPPPEPGVHPTATTSLGRQHRLYEAPRRYDSLPADSCRWRSLLCRRRPRSPGRR
jgi:acetamidase/formamidase